MFVIAFFGFVAVCGTAFVQLGRVPCARVVGCRSRSARSRPRSSSSTTCAIAPTDARAGKRTLAVRFGRARRARRVRARCSRSRTRCRSASRLRRPPVAPRCRSDRAARVSRGCARSSRAVDRPRAQRLPRRDRAAAARCTALLFAVGLALADDAVVRGRLPRSCAGRSLPTRRGAARGRTERAAMIVAVRDATGATGLGEAAPLPGMSIDTLDDARRALRRARRARAVRRSRRRATRRAIAASHARPRLPRGSRSRPRCSSRSRQRTPTSARAAARRRCRRPSCAAVAIVVDDADEARAAVALGARCLKIKVGGHRPTSTACIAIAAPRPARRCALDANRGWPRARRRAHCSPRSPSCRSSTSRSRASTRTSCSREPLPCRIALDESLVDARPPTQLARALASPRLAALVLKPTLLGGFARCLALAAARTPHGVAPIVTHALEGPVGTAACPSSRARSAPARRPRPHPALAASHASSATPLAPRSRRRDGALDERRCPIATAASSRRADRPRRDATSTTVDAIHAALDARRPIALLHAAPPGRRARAPARARRSARRSPTTTRSCCSRRARPGPPRGVVLSRAALDRRGRGERGAPRLARRRSLAAARCRSRTPAGCRSSCAASLARQADRARRRRLPIATRCRRTARACTLASLVPTQLAALLDDPAWRPPPTLRAVLLGGAAAPGAARARRSRAACRSCTTYGLTETFGQVATARRPRRRSRRAAASRSPASSVTAGTRAAPRADRVRGPMLATRYLDGAPIAPELVDRATSASSTTASLHVVGRADDVIITGGENVHPLRSRRCSPRRPASAPRARSASPTRAGASVVAAAVAVDAGFDRGARARALARDARRRTHGRAELAIVGDAAAACRPASSIGGRRASLPDAHCATADSARYAWYTPGRERPVSRRRGPRRVQAERSRRSRAHPRSRSWSRCAAARHGYRTPT